MKEENFNELGKMEAISLLFESCGYNPEEGNSFLPANDAVVKTASKIFTEGINFDLIYFPPKHLGYKCITAVAGEIYSHFAEPRVMNVTIGVSAKIDFNGIKELWKGMTVAAKEHHILKVSLDLVPSLNGLLVSVSMNGVSSRDVEEKRGKAKSKDLICVTGSLGAAYLGLKFLMKEKSRVLGTGKEADSTVMDKYKMIVGDYLKPEINPDIVSQMREDGVIPSFGYLVDHGLSDAMRKLGRDSGLGVKVYAQKIPFEGNSFDLGKELDIDPVTAAMNGGEDYRLLFTIPIADYDKLRHDFQAFDIVGHLAQPEVGTVFVTPEGLEMPVKSQGWKNED